MMTREQKIDAFAMRLDGYTLQEIGDKYGVTKEYIRQIVGDYMVQRKKEAANNRKTVSLKQRAKKREEMAERIIYPGIREWAKKRGETPSTIASGISKDRSATYYQILTSKQKQGPSLCAITEILQFTGLTFEAAFGGTNAQ